MIILYIHGANSTKRSFAYLAPTIGALIDDVEYVAHYFEYDTHEPCTNNIANCQKLVNEIKPDVIIGHSLGGLIAAYMITRAKKISIASPFGGSAIANWLPMYSQLMRDIATTSVMVRGLRMMEVDGTDFLSIVANGLDGGGFDGVVSQRSQMTLNGPDYRSYDLNHFEVLVDEEVASVISKWICPPAIH